MNENITHKIGNQLHSLYQSYSDTTSTVSAAIGGATGGFALFAKNHPQFTELVIHTGSICLYSAVGAATGVFVKLATERMITWFDKKFRQNNTDK